MVEVSIHFERSTGQNDQTGFIERTINNGIDALGPCSYLVHGDASKSRTCSRHFNYVSKQKFSLVGKVNGKEGSMSR
jgi:hypothetical protein